MLYTLGHYLNHSW